MQDLLDKVASYQNASDIVNDRVFNTQLCDEICAHRDGPLEKFAAPGELLIKRRLRERSLVHRVWDVQPAKESEITSIPGREQPVIWGTLPPESRGAVSLSMKDTADQESFWREDWIVDFFVLSTPEYYKNEFELKGHPQDTVKALTEDLVLDLEDQFDNHVWAGIDEAVGAAGSPSSTTGLVQNFFCGPFSNDHYVKAKYLLPERKLPQGVFVVNERFMANFESTDMKSLLGDTMKDKLFSQGGDALKEGVIGNISHIFTNKNELVQNDVMYQFTAQDYIGIAREYQPPTLFMEKKKRTIFFSLETIVAVGLTRAQGVLKCVFQNAPTLG